MLDEERQVLQTVAHVEQDRILVSTLLTEMSVHEADLSKFFKRPVSRDTSTWNKKPSILERLDQLPSRTQSSSHYRSSSVGGGKLWGI
jgi:hypothetical protein